MNLVQANQLLRDADCSDPDAVAMALTLRARAIAEFASTASGELLRETFAVGEALRDRLALAQIEARRELDQMTKLSRGLEGTLGEDKPERISCFG